ncbi:MAG: 1-acyl-sn-glycerol-3-phosphate acyltransferase [Polyangiaceae bacterium]
MVVQASPHVGAPSPSYLAAYNQIMRPLLDRMWPLEFSGRENLPEHDRYLLVANHSGVGIVEVLSLVAVWSDHVGFERRVAAMAHPALFRMPGFRSLVHAAGCVEATRAGARFARDSGAALLVFPGGDHESMRPLWEADRVDFAGRKGWIKLARELDLTVVPVAITGTHVTLPNLGWSKVLAWASGPRLFGMRRVPIPLLSVIGAGLSLIASRGKSVPTRLARAFAAYWGLAVIPFIPSKIGFHILPELTADELAAEEDQVYARVTSDIERVLTRASRARRGADRRAAVS